MCLMYYGKEFDLDSISEEFNSGKRYSHFLNRSVAGSVNNAMEGRGVG